MRSLTLAAALAAFALVACGPPPPPLVPSVDIERYCTARIACGLQSASNNALAACVANQRQTLGAFAGYGLSFEDAQRINCYLMQPSCAMAAACASRMHDASYCVLHPGISCDGAVRVDCTNTQEISTLDCARLGMSCRNGTAPGTASCTTGRSCTAAAARCDGNTRVLCVNNLEWREDCELVQHNSTCAGAPEGATCLPAHAPACSTSGFTARCEMNNVAVNCGRSGFETRIPCATGTTCMAMGAQAVCAPDATTCTDGENDTCMGNQVQYCLEGRRISVACGAVGTTMCGSLMSGGSGCQ